MEAVPLRPGAFLTVWPRADAICVGANCCVGCFLCVIVQPILPPATSLLWTSSYGTRAGMEEAGGVEAAKDKGLIDRY
jgi:hypothetical protein